jgi:(4-alkanoyl-5-oxo-2,5-dihydrofuran-3-yl)methyl phosphate reductase
MADSLILVTGATGTVGSEVVKQLVAGGHRVRALVRDPARAERLGTGVELVVGDLERPETLGPAFAGVERAFVLAQPTPQLETLEGHAFEAARVAGVGQVVKLSAFGVGVFGMVPFTRHGASEARLRDSGFAWTILRPTRFMNYTPFPWTWDRQHGTVHEATGDAQMTLIDPVDIAAVAVAVLTTSGHDGQVYELTSAEALTGAELARTLAVALVRPVSFVDSPPAIVREWILRTGAPDFIADATLNYFAAVRAGGWYVTSTVADLLGRPARTYAEWLHEHGASLA